MSFCIFRAGEPPSHLIKLNTQPAAEYTDDDVIISIASLLVNPVEETSLS